MTNHSKPQGSHRTARVTMTTDFTYQASQTNGQGEGKGEGSLIIPGRQRKTVATNLKHFFLSTNMRWLFVIYSPLVCFIFAESCFLVLGGRIDCCRALCQNSWNPPLLALP